MIFVRLNTISLLSNDKKNYTIPIYYIGIIHQKSSGIYRVFHKLDVTVIMSKSIENRKKQCHNTQIVILFLVHNYYESKFFDVNILMFEYFISAFKTQTAAYTLFVYCTA